MKYPAVVAVKQLQNSESNARAIHIFVIALFVYQKIRKAGENAMILYQCQRKGDSYRKYPLTLGCVYGRDDVSPFVCLHEYAREGKTGLHASVRLFRLDMDGRRDWHEVWETSETTRAIIRISLMQGKSMRPIARFGTENRIAEVPRKHGHVRIYG